MLVRLGLAGRLVAILGLALILFGLIGIAVEWYGRTRLANEAPRVPLPDQVAAIVDVLERSGPARRNLVLRAVSSEHLRVEVTSKRPPEGPGRRMPFAEWLVGQYLEALPSRGVEVRMKPDDEGWSWRAWRGRFSSNFSAPLEIVVPLAGGEFAIFETRGPATQRLFGLPTGFWIGVLGTLLGALAIAAIAREAKPIGELARSVQRFAADVQPAPVTPRGAPDVKALIEAVNAMQGRIAALLRGRTILLGAVSHDLKTYITRLRLRVEDLPGDDSRDKAIRDLDDMTALIDSAIAVARGASAVTIHERVDLVALIRAEIAARGDAPVSIATAPPVAVVDGDAVGLRRVVGNLIDNALRYGTRCDLTITVDRAAVELWFDDDGPGVPPAERLVIFEPFYRAEGSRNRATGGSGLGLAIVSQIVAAHGGTIEVTDAPGRGARMRIVLPQDRERRAA